MSSLRTFLNGQFETLHLRSMKFLERLPEEKIFWKPPAEGFETYSAGELLIRSAAAVEQTFGGITRRLWDDPFEWTLPEKLSTIELVVEYLSEVDDARLAAFCFLTDDDSLLKTLPAPVEIKPIAQVLGETLLRAEHYLGRGY